MSEDELTYYDDRHPEYRKRVQAWAAKRLGVDPQEVALTWEAIDGCGNGTCLWELVQIDVQLRDGHRFRTVTGFHDYFDEILDDMERGWHDDVQFTELDRAGSDVRGRR